MHIDRAIYQTTFLNLTLEMQRALYFDAFAATDKTKKKCGLYVKPSLLPVVNDQIVLRDLCFAGVVTTTRSGGLRSHKIAQVVQSSPENADLKHVTSIYVDGTKTETSSCPIPAWLAEKAGDDGQACLEFSRETQTVSLEGHTMMSVLIPWQ
eukprot:5941504-Karenia_brevis.AAC.1